MNSRAFRDANGGIEETFAGASSAAEEAVRATAGLIAKKGRASYLGDRSKGHKDPGASSSALILRASAEALAQKR